ncbi:hypothetical protein T190115A13A_10370 [Tenacibaculum sp. 190524A02b]|uniref:Uncharacterized protein n=1 Tax=Tenacibaculum vairaonense TaxID=3137860 RepID=A0ABP1FD02_9FLAO
MKSAAFNRFYLPYFINGYNLSMIVEHVLTIAYRPFCVA